jgi:uracil-DNA glycosylase
MKNVRMDPSWLEKLRPELELPYMQQLRSFLVQEAKAGAEVYPPANQVFEALFLTPFDQAKVVLMGQDPYHGPGQAHGLCFSVAKGVRPPPSLQNIFKELDQDLQLPRPSHGCLESWAHQGVLLLNATLTVRANEAKSHFGRGWEQFTDRIIQLLSERSDPIVFVLWGKSALDKWKQLSPQANSHHLVLTAAHPSPLSAYAGFLGCRHFSQINNFLKRSGKEPINWLIPS